MPPKKEVYPSLQFGDSGLLVRATEHIVIIEMWKQNQPCVEAPIIIGSTSILYVGGSS